MWRRLWKYRVGRTVEARNITEGLRTIQKGGGIGGYGSRGYARGGGLRQYSRAEVEDFNGHRGYAGRRLETIQKGGDEEGYGSHEEQQGNMQPANNVRSRQ